MGVDLEVVGLQIEGDSIEVDFESLSLAAGQSHAWNVVITPVSYMLPL